MVFPYSLNLALWIGWGPRISRLMRNTLDALSIIKEGLKFIGVRNLTYLYHNFTDCSVVEEKYGKSPRFGGRDRRDLDSDASGGSETSSDSEEEDDEGILASGALDEQFHATLDAIRSKDPRVYDTKTTFYMGIEDEHADYGITKVKEKPMYLGDYHRKNLLEGDAGIDDKPNLPRTYTQQQDDLKKSIVKEMHAGGDSSVLSSDNEDADGGFLVRKPATKVNRDQIIREAPIKSLDVQSADKDPETYLSNFLSARAWVPSDNSKFQPFESDDEEEDRRAEAFEEAYNLRFEDPKSSNDKLMSHARDTVAKYSVRRDSINPRKRAREAEQSKKEAERLEREQEKVRLRKMRLEEAEIKINKIKEAAGFRGEMLQDQDWVRFLDENWDDMDWEAVMRKRFGHDYYAENEANDSGNGERAGKIKPRKPKWDDDIDIKDLLPEFDDEKPQFSLSDDSANEVGDVDNTIDDSGAIRPRSLNEQSSRRSQYKQKKEAKQNRQKVEQLVEQRLGLDFGLSGSSKKQSTFKYRETSPLTYGLTTQDILMASDGQLNQYAGLKKMATFRDADKKRKDKKKLGKKGRLRQWRKETFGNEKGPEKSLKDVIAEQASQEGVELANAHGSALVQRKRSRKNKQLAS